MDIILDRVVGWAEVNAELRIHLLGWLTTRTDDQILGDAVEMVDALKNMAYTDNITKMGEEILTTCKEGLRKAKVSRRRRMPLQPPRTTQTPCRERRQRMQQQ